MRAVPKLGVALALAAVALAGCGGSDHAAKALLARAFSRPVGTADVTFEVSGTLNGSRPFTLRAVGPYQSNGPRRLPSFQLALNVIGGGRSFEAGATSTGSDAYVTLAGATYDIGSDRVARTNAQLTQGGGRSLASFGLDPSRWVHDAQIAGDAQVGGVATTHVHADVDVAALVSDLRRAASGASSLNVPQLNDQQVSAARQAIHNPTLDVYVAKSDGRLRRLAVSLSFQLSRAQQARLPGLRTGSVFASLELANLGRPVSIGAPPNAQPLAALSGGTGSGAGAPSPQKLQAYSRCLRGAGSSIAALQRCNALLR